jgi:hypothetical protein
MANGQAGMHLEYTDAALSGTDMPAPVMKDSKARWFL